MDCHFQKPLTDEQLWSAIDGEADAEVRAHLAQCEGCGARLADIRQFEFQLQRGVHPTSQQLTNFQAELLSGSIHRLITEHVTHCAICQTELTTLAELSADVAIPDSFNVPAPNQRPHRSERARLNWGDAVRELVAHLLQPPANAPRLAGVNVLGHHANILTAEANGLRIHLTMEPVRNEIVVSGQVVTDEEADQAAWEGATLALTHLDAGLRSITLLNDLGEFACQPLPPGLAYLRIRTTDGRAVVLDEFQLTGRGGP